MIAAVSKGPSICGEQHFRMASNIPPATHWLFALNLLDSHNRWSCHVLSWAGQIVTDVGVERPGKKGGKFNFSVNFIPIHHSFFLKARFNDEIVSVLGV